MGKRIPTSCSFSASVTIRPWTLRLRESAGLNAAQAMVDVIAALRGIEVPDHEVLGEGTLVLTDIKSEPYPGLSVVPDYCVATFDRRTLPGETEADVLQPITDLMEDALRESRARGRASIAEDDFETYTGARVVAPNFAPAWFFEEGHPLVRVAVEAVRSAGIKPLLSHYAFCTNGSGTAGRLGIPTIGFGPGDEELAHRVDEFIEIEDLTRGAAGYAALAAHLAGEGG